MKSQRCPTHPCCRTPVLPLPPAVSEVEVVKAGLDTQLTGLWVDPLASHMVLASKVQVGAHAFGEGIWGGGTWGGAPGLTHGAGSICISKCSCFSVGVSEGGVSRGVPLAPYMAQAAKILVGVCGLEIWGGAGVGHTCGG